MGISGLLKQDKPQTDDAVAWAEMGDKLSEMLWHIVQTNPDIVASPDAAVILRDDGNIRIASHAVESLEPNDVGCVLFRQDRAAHDEWVDDLLSYETEIFHRDATEDFAKRLVRMLAANAGRTNVRPSIPPVINLHDDVAIASSKL